MKRGIGREILAPSCVSPRPQSSPHISLLMPDPDAPPTSANLDKYASDSRLYWQFLGAFHDALLGMVRATAPGSVLDAGCGEGFVTALLARELPDATLQGIDVSPDAIAYARQHHNHCATFHTGSLYVLPFPDGAFDTVVCSEVLEHLEDPDAAVAELKRVARRAVVITVPREPYFRVLNGLGRVLGRAPDPGHVNFWTKQSFQAFIHRHFETPSFAWKHIFQLASARLDGRGD